MTSPKSDCYRLIQQIAVKRDPKCIICGAPSTVGHHLFKRSRMATAFLPEAVRGLCHYHHDYLQHHRKWFRDIMIGQLGDRYYELERLSNTVVKVDFKAKREELRGILNYLENREVTYCRISWPAFGVDGFIELHDDF